MNFFVCLVLFLVYEHTHIHSCSRLYHYYDLLFFQVVDITNSLLYYVYSDFVHVHDIILKTKSIFITLNYILWINFEQTNRREKKILTLKFLLSTNNNLIINWSSFKWTFLSSHYKWMKRIYFFLSAIKKNAVYNEKVWSFGICCCFYFPEEKKNPKITRW